MNATPECDGDGNLVWYCDHCHRTHPDKTSDYTCDHCVRADTFEPPALKWEKCPGCRRCDPCPLCEGSGYTIDPLDDAIESATGMGPLQHRMRADCPDCGGTGKRKSDG